MTRVIDGAKVFDYSEWIKLPEVINMLNESGECSTCYGSGEHECECGDTHTCGACNGTGNNINLREHYEHMLREEIKKLSAWRLGAPIKNPFCWLSESELKARRRTVPVVFKFTVKE